MHHWQRRGARFKKKEIPMLAKFLAKLKALPLAAKIVLGIFVLLLCYGASQHHPPYSGGSGNYGGGGGSYGGDNNGSQIEQLRAQENHLAQLAQQCQVQMNQNAAQWARDAANGVMPTSQAPCEAQMPAWIAQMKGIESQLRRLQASGGSGGGGSYGGGAQGSYASGGGSQPNYYHPTDPNAPSYNHPDTSTDAVDKWDRNYIRGTSNYTDESGEVHELETQPYYSQDNQTGQYVGSTDNTVPNDTHTYTPLTNNDDPQ
jgi:hypothetical protein